MAGETNTSTSGAPASPRGQPDSPSNCGGGLPATADATGSWSAVPSGLPAAPRPERVGQYRIVEPLGKGGMGEVYLAEQTAPIRRQVALKVVRWGTDSREVVQRFEAERQVLALMAHSNVAKVYDAGVTDDGRPFFVMEYVPGAAITTYCDRQRMPICERLRLFVSVCEAVQHAHQRGVIHRDLKPSNILVGEEDGRPRPKIIDFGIARAIEPRIGDGRLTQTGQIIGTPAYMSPEQADLECADIDTRTDVYSLGIVLYELLVGALPIGTATLREAGFGRILRMIRETNPPTPSARVSRHGRGATPQTGQRHRDSSEAGRLSEEHDEPATAAHHRSTDFRTLFRDLRGDLDWITMKAMSKERAARYASASELAADISRYLAGDPIEAKRDHRWYVLRKTVRRYRAAVSVAAAFVLLAGGSALVSEHFRRQAVAAGRAEAEQRRRAETETTKANGFLGAIDGILDLVTTRRITFHEVLQRAAGRFAEKSDENSDVAAAVRSRFGRTFLRLGDYETSRVHLDSALQQQRSAADTPAADLAETLRAAARLEFEQHSNVAATERLLREALEVSGDESADSLAANLQALGSLYFERGESIRATALFHREYELRTPGGMDRLACVHNIAYTLFDVAEYETGEAYCREVTAALRAEPPDDARDEALAESLSALGPMLLHQGLVEQGATLVEEALATRRRLFREPSKEVASGLVIMGQVEMNRGRYADAERYYRDGLAMQERVFSTSEHLAVAFTEVSLAAALAEQGKDAEARELFAGACDKYTSLLGRVSTLAPLYFYYNRGVLRRRSGDFAAAEALLNEALAMYQELTGTESGQVAMTLNALGLVKRDAGELAAAEQLCRDALTMRRSVLFGGHPSVPSGLVDLASVFTAAGKHAEAQAALREAVELQSKLVPPISWPIALAEAKLGRSLMQAGDRAAAEPLRRGVRVLTQELSTADPRTIEAVAWLRECDSGGAGP